MSYHDEFGRVCGALRRQFAEVTSNPEFQFRVAQAKLLLKPSWRDDVLERTFTPEQRATLERIRTKHPH